MADLSILLIEDDDAHAELLRRRLPEDTVQFRRAQTLREGLDLLREEAADVVLTDLNLPDSDSDETLSRIASELPDTPVIVLTSLDDADFARRCVADGAQDYLVKDEITSSAVMRSIRYAIERKHLMVDLARSNAELKAFANTVAHEVRSPAATALMALSGLRSAGPGQAPQFIQIAERSLSGLNDLVADMLNFAEVDAAAPTNEEVNLNGVMDAVVERSRQSLANVGGRVEVGALPVVHGHHSQFKLLFQNLVDNAIKYRSPERPLVLSVTSTTPEAGDSARDTPSDVPASAPEDSDFFRRRKFEQEATEGRGHRIDVRDNGLGIADEHLPRLFDIFYRAHRSLEQIPGTGIGLALCKRIVPRYGGDIRVLSSPGRSTTFQLFFPEIESAAGD